MGLFGFGRKKEEVKETPSCCCGTPAAEEKEAPCCCGGTEEAAASGCCCSGECGITSIKVLGAGCKSCHEMNEACIAAVKELGMNLAVEYVTDMEKITAYGVMSMPALVINEKVVSMGKVMKPADIIKLFKKLGYC